MKSTAHLLTESCPGKPECWPAPSLQGQGGAGLFVSLSVVVYKARHERTIHLRMRDHPCIHSATNGRVPYSSNPFAGCTSGQFQLRSVELPRLPRCGSILRLSIKGDKRHGCSCRCACWPAFCFHGPQGPRVHDVAWWGVGHRGPGHLLVCDGSRPGCCRLVVGNDQGS